MSWYVVSAWSDSTGLARPSVQGPFAVQQVVHQADPRLTVLVLEASSAHEALAKFYAERFGPGDPVVGRIVAGIFAALLVALVAFGLFSHGGCSLCVPGPCIGEKSK